MDGKCLLVVMLNAQRPFKCMNSLELNKDRHLIRIYQPSMQDLTLCTHWDRQVDATIWISIAPNQQ